MASGCLTARTGDRERAAGRLRSSSFQAAPDRPRRDSSHGSEVVVYVAGAVIRPGVYVLPDGSRCDDAVRRAGGFRANADPDAVNLAERITDGQEILVSRIGQAVAHPSHSRSKRRSRPAPAQSVDLNTADAATLASLPGIGTELASRIVEYRQLNGPFASIDELADVSGMTQRRIDALTPYARLHEAP